MPFAQQILGARWHAPGPQRGMMYGSCAGVMAEGNRLGALPKVISSYEELLRAHRGEVLATVTAALVWGGRS